MMTPQDYVQQKAVASGSSFYYAFLFLPTPGARPSPRFMRFAARSMTWWTTWWTPAWPATKLAWWQSEVNKSFAGQPSHPVMQALMPLRCRLQH
jgi:phytoene synthase